MNRFEVFHLNAVRQNALVGIEFSGYIAYGIFDELGVFVGILGYKFFIATLEATPKLAGSARLGNPNLFL